MVSITKYSSMAAGKLLIMLVMNHYEFVESQYPYRSSDVYDQSYNPPQEENLEYGEKPLLMKKGSIVVIIFLFFDNL